MVGLCVYDVIILAMFYLFRSPKNTRCWQNFGTNHLHKHVIKKNKQNCANVEALPQGFLFIAEQGFELNRGGCNRNKLFSERLEIRFQTPNNRSIFLIIFWVESSEKFASAET